MATVLRKRDEESQHESLGGKEPAVTRIFDSEANSFVELGTLEVLVKARKLHLEGGLSRLQIASRFKVSITTIKSLEKLDLLVPEVLQLLSTERVPSCRLSFAAATLISSLRDDLQQEVAEKHLAGRCSMEKIRELLKKQINWQSSGKSSCWRQNRPVNRNPHEPIVKFEIQAKGVAAAILKLTTTFENLKEFGVLPNSMAQSLEKDANTLNLSLETLTTIVEEIRKK